MLYIGFIEIPFMLFSVFYVGESCQGWGREFESPFPLQIQKALIERLGLFLCFNNLQRTKKVYYPL